MGRHCLPPSEPADAAVPCEEAETSAETGELHLNEDRNGIQAVPKDGKLNPLMAIESRPSSLTGFSIWLVLSYKEHQFSEMLPPDFMAMDEAMQSFAVLPAADILKKKLRPILEAEDAEDLKPKIILG